MTTVTESPQAPQTDAVPAATDEEVPEEITQWARDYADRLTKPTLDRLAQMGQHAASPNGSANGNGSADELQPRIGEPTTLGRYVAFDVAATSPIQITGLPPYQPGKVIAAGERAYIVAFLFVNPVASIPAGFAVPPTVQLGGRRWRATLDLLDLTTLNRTKQIRTAIYPAVAPSIDFVIYQVPTPNPGPDAAVYEANVTLDIVDPAQPYAAFATNFFDVDADPGELFVPPSQPGWRHELPNRYLVYSK
jgi:hypothetical protein